MERPPGFLDYLVLGPATSLARQVHPSWDTVRSAISLQGNLHQTIP